jgi:hypothetical protein
VVAKEDNGTSSGNHWRLGPNPWERRVRISDELSTNSDPTHLNKNQIPGTGGFIFTLYQVIV